MKAQSTAILTSATTLIVGAAFAACVALSVSKPQATQRIKSAPATAQTVTFTEQEVPHVMGYPQRRIQTVSFEEKEVPMVLIERPSKPATLARK
ncbi:hypothetical protein L6R29_05675 [Myxococcota bacterium]|nr:hypothetical protein [Myxococcota bacterium]